MNIIKNVKRNKCYTITATSPMIMIEELVPSNTKDFSLKELQEIVGGSIQMIYLEKNLVMVLNEEGKLLNLRDNRLATDIALIHNAIDTSDYIAGNVLICKKKFIK